LSNRILLTAPFNLPSFTILELAGVIVEEYEQ